MTQFFLTLEVQGWFKCIRLPMHFTTLIEKWRKNNSMIITIDTLYVFDEN